MKSEPKKQNDSLTLAFVLVRVWAMTLYLPLRRSVGKDHVGLAGLLGFALVFFYTGLTHAGPLILLIPLLAVHHFCLNVGRLVRRRDGVVEHTEWGGEPWIAMRLFFTKNEWFAKQIGEPAIIAAIGFGLSRWFPITATYLWWGSAAMVVNHFEIERYRRRVFDQMNNAQIENEFFAQRN